MIEIFGQMLQNKVVVSRVSVRVIGWTLRHRAGMLIIWPKMPTSGDCSETEYLQKQLSRSGRSGVRCGVKDTTISNVSDLV